MAADNEGPSEFLIGLLLLLCGLLGAVLGFWLLHQRDAGAFMLLLGLICGALGGFATAMLIYVIGPLIELIEAALWLGYASVQWIMDRCLGWLARLRFRLAARRPALPQDRPAPELATQDWAADLDDMHDGPYDPGENWHHVGPPPVPMDRPRGGSGLDQVIPRGLRLFGFGSALLFAGVAAIWLYRQGAAPGAMILGLLGAALAGFYLSLLVNVASSLLAAMIGLLVEVLAHIAMRMILALPASWQRRAESAVFRFEGRVYLWVERPLRRVDEWMWPPDLAD